MPAKIGRSMKNFDKVMDTDARTSVWPRLSGRCLHLCGRQSPGRLSSQVKSETKLHGLLLGTSQNL